MSYMGLSELRQFKRMCREKLYDVLHESRLVSYSNNLFMKTDFYSA